MHRATFSPFLFPSARARAFSPVLALLCAALATGCDEPKKSEGSPSATASAPAAPTTARTVEAPKTMPVITVDSQGIFITGTRIKLSDPKGPEKLVEVVKGLPVEGNPATVVADKKAKTPDVAAIVAQLGDAGAPKVTIKTDGRDDLAKEIVVVPASRVSKPDGCTVAAMVLKDLSTAVWPMRGGLGKRQRKGFAGPDLSHTAETLTKDIGSCKSNVAIVSADDSVIWEHAFNLAGTVLKADEKKALDTLVLPREAPVAGRPISLGKP